MSLSPQMMATYKGEFSLSPLLFLVSLIFTAAFAASLAPTPSPAYKIVHTWHHWIQVPTGHLPIYVSQFDRGLRSNGEQRPYHWAIVIPTSTRRGFGNFYEIGGSLREGYRLQHVVNNRHLHWADERGMHLAGHVAPEYLEALETRFALILVIQGKLDWNCQTWVVEALQGLNNPRMYVVQVDYGQCTSRWKSWRQPGM